MAQTTGQEVLSAECRRNRIIHSAHQESRGEVGVVRFAVLLVDDDRPIKDDVFSPGSLDTWDQVERLTDGEWAADPA